MSQFKRRLIITFIRPIMLREIPGWGKLYDLFVGSRQNNSFWKDEPAKTIRGKRHGFLMELDIASWSERYAFFAGRWYDLPTQLLLEAVLKPGDAVIDIGGNIGMFSLSARALIGPEGKIIAFEPNPVPRAKFERHVEINSLNNIELLDVALHEKEGTARFNFPKDFTGEGSLSTLDYPESEMQSIEVTIKIGDDVLRNINPKLVKIDVEGAEVGVLNGLQELTARAHPIIVAECLPNHLKRFGHSFSDLLSFASQQGYKAFYLGMRKRNWKYKLYLKSITDHTPVGSDIVLIHESDRELIARITN